MVLSDNKEERKPSVTINFFQGKQNLAREWRTETDKYSWNKGRKKKLNETKEHLQLAHMQSVKILYWVAAQCEKEKGEKDLNTPLKENQRAVSYSPTFSSQVFHPSTTSLALPYTPSPS